MGPRRQRDLSRPAAGNLGHREHGGLPLVEGARDKDFPGLEERQLKTHDPVSGSGINLGAGAGRLHDSNDAEPYVHRRPAIRSPPIAQLASYVAPARKIRPLPGPRLRFTFAG